MIEKDLYEELLKTD
jgi:hypothetical protein